MKEKGTFVLGLDDSFPPMGFRDEDNNIVGFDIDVAREVCSRMGVELELMPIDWDSKVSELNDGKVDCLWNGFTTSPEREAESFSVTTTWRFFMYGWDMVISASRSGLVVKPFQRQSTLPSLSSLTLLSQSMGISSSSTPIRLHTSRATSMSNPTMLLSSSRKPMGGKESSSPSTKVPFSFTLARESSDAPEGVNSSGDSGVVRPEPGIADLR